MWTYLSYSGVFILGFTACIFFAAHKQQTAPLYGGVDIEDSFTSLRNGIMTEDDEMNLQDAAKFERKDRRRVVTRDFSHG